MPASSQQIMRQTEDYSAHNYSPLPVVIASADGAWFTDVEGERYLDGLAGYSAMNFGHRNPRILARAHRQLDTVSLTSRAFYNDQLGPFAQALSELTGKDRILPMNSGAEAVETALKVARKWGYRVKGVPEDQASIVVMEGNFHGRTTTIISFSDDKLAHDAYGPFTPGFRSVPFGDLEALKAAIDDTTVAVLIEPIQGEAGVILPPDGYLPAVREVCTATHTLMIGDEIQSGLGRAGTTFALEREGVVPDLYTLGKALGGGVVALSAVAADAAIMDVVEPGSHGSTFGGNPFACAVGHEVVGMLAEGTFQQAATERGAQLEAGLRPLVGQGLRGLRVRGLWAGLDVDPSIGTGRAICERLLAHKVLTKDTHGSTIRLSPPLMVSEDDIDFLVDAVTRALTD